MFSISCCGMPLLLMSFLCLLKLHLRESILPQLISCAAEDQCLERLLSASFIFLRIHPFLSENENAAAYQAFQPILRLHLVSYVLYLYKCSLHPCKKFLYFNLKV